MSSFNFKVFGTILLFSIGVSIVYQGLKFLFLHKIKINKWIVFAGALIAIFIPMFLGGNLTGLPLYIQSGTFMILFLWFIDLNGFGTKKTKNDKLVIKPKAKPNRIKKNK